MSGLLPSASTLISASADKTVAVWRVGSNVLHSSRAWDISWGATPQLETWGGKEASPRLFLTDPVVALDSIGSKVFALDVVAINIPT